MAKVELGKDYMFAPSAFAGEKDGMLGGKIIKKTLTGKIAYINRRHRFFMVEAETPQGAVIRECFKF